MAFRIVTEWLARIEHKLDIIMRTAKPDIFSTVPLHFVGTMCPLCQQTIDYQIDPEFQVVVRRCGCKTGKVPSATPLLPVTQGDVNARVSEYQEQPRPDAEDRPRRKAR